MVLYYFRATGHHKYALQALLCHCQLIAVLSPKMSAHLTWSQFCSASTGGNKANDLALEHNNHHVKAYLTSMGSNKTVRAIQRRVMSSVALADISKGFQVPGESATSGWHTAKPRAKDVQVMAGILCGAAVFQESPDRAHTCFPLIASPLKKLCDPACRKLFQSWAKGHKKKLTNNQLYQSVFTQAAEEPIDVGHESYDDSSDASQ